MAKNELDLQMEDYQYLPLRDVVFRTLRQAILRGELKPGERLMEIRLANQLGVSRTPIREAIRMLELDGLVIMVPRKGAQVAQITEKNLRDVLEVRRALDALAVELACERITEDELAELKKAEHFIFMEYHAIEDASAWQELEDILAERAAHGVEVRVFYDDVGSIGFINSKFVKKLAGSGIQCRRFNPVIPILNVFMNNRDHRKITVVDGRVGFTGGYNLAEEYFNRTHPYGRWKDTGIRLEGDAVRSLTLIFLELWGATQKEPPEIERYLPEVPYTARENAVVLPYADNPLDDEATGENVYLNMIRSAKEYVYITTPYLILSDEMQRTLRLAASSGVDVRIITPGIPDKKLIFSVTRSYYAALAKSGVRIYEYTPGFIHAKQCVADGAEAVVGTINFDFRSLYLHFELSLIHI